jgi:hypothetical protein
VQLPFREVYIIPCVWVMNSNPAAGVQMLKGFLGDEAAATRLMDWLLATSYER